MRIIEIFRIVRRVLKVNLVYSMIINFRHFGFSGLLKMPIIINYGSRFNPKSKGGIVFLQPLQTNMLSIYYGNRINVDTGGKIIFTGLKACFNYKNDVHVYSDGVMEIGNNFYSNGENGFHCRKGLKFGDDVMLSVNILFLDTDYHPIFDSQGERINLDREIVIGNDVWIGCRALVLKGSFIGNNIIVGAGSLVSGKLLSENSIYSGNPANLKKKDITWHH